MKRKNNIKAFPYLLPALVSIIAVTIVPIIYTIFISFTNYNMYHLDDFSMVGLKNYLDVCSGSIKDVFLPVLGWTLVFAILSTFGSYFTGLILAIVLNNPNMKESKIYRAILIVPWVNNVLSLLALPKVPWLTDPTCARIGIIIVNIWLGFPYMLNVCLGGLQAISKEYYEAAAIDGASKHQSFVSITLPLVTRLSIPLIISSFAANFNNFGNIYMITQGGPARPDNQFAGYTDILASTTYKMTTMSNRYELSATFSVLCFLIVGTLTLVWMHFSGAFKEVD